jgi:uncharacterized protein (DUF488 family)
MPTEDNAAVSDQRGKRIDAMQHEQLWTVGHSTRSAESFVEVLAAYEIEIVADVRRFAGSRRLPQFGATELRATLADAGIWYLELPSLGGRRNPDPESLNLGWRNSAFRGYADHIASEEFAEGLFALMMVAGGARTAIMCAEVLWWRCHRRLIADVLTVLGTSVVHIRDERHSDPHRLAPPARVVRGRLSYRM